MAEQLDEQDQRLASRRVADALRAGIESGELAVGALLPTFRQLAAEHGVARNTAMAAVQLLRDEGLVTHRPNARAYVRDRSNLVDTEQELRTLRAELGDLQSQVRQAGANLSAIDGRISELMGRLRALE